MAVVGLVPFGACLLVSTTTRYRVGAIAPLALGTALLAGFAFEALRDRRRRDVAAAVGAAASCPP